MANREPIFGRQGDLAYLQDRIKRPGVTVIASRPQQGKTRLLEELCDTIRTKTGGETCLVGYAAATRETPDLLLRSLQDMYTYWLQDSTYFAQARMVFKQQKKKGVIEIIGAAGAPLVNRLTPLILASGAAGTVGAVVGEFFEGLLHANHALTTGEIQLPRLTYDQALNVVKLLCAVTKKNAVVIMDAYEQSPNPYLEAGSIHRYLEKIDTWPTTHFLIACREPAQEENEEAAFKEARLFQVESAAATIFSLPPMQLDDSTERNRLLDYILKNVPATANVQRKEVLRLLDSYPGTLVRWRQGRPGTEADLRKLARDARRLHYREIAPVLSALNNQGSGIPLFDVAARLILLPESTYASPNEGLGAIALADCPGHPLDQLTDRGLLVHGAAIGHSFGLTARYEEARAVLLTNPRWKTRLRNTAESLVLTLAGEIRSIDARAHGAIFALINLREAAHLLGLADAYKGLCESAASLVGRGDPSLIRAAANFAVAHQSAAALASFALVNAQNYAKADGHVALRESLLEQQRTLVARYPEDAAVRQELTKALSNALASATGEGDGLRQIALLESLRSLARQFSEDGAVRRVLAIALFNAHYNLRADGNTVRRDALLQELRTQARQYPEDGAVREELAKALFNTQNSATVGGDVIRQRALLEELCTLARQHHGDAAVRKQLAKALFNTLCGAIAEANLSRRDALLGELRKLAAQYPEDTAVREEFAKALVNTQMGATASGSPIGPDAPLEEVRALARQYPADAAVRGLFAKALFNTQNEAMTEGDLVRRDLLVDELRSLAQRHPADEVVREQLARALLNTLTSAMEEVSRPRLDALLEEICTLAGQHPADAAVRGQLAKALFNTLYGAIAEGDVARRDELVEKLGTLVRQYPGDSTTRQQFAQAMVNTQIDAAAHGDLARRDALLEELRKLAAQYPGDAAVRKPLAVALFNTQLHAKAEDALVRRDASLEELRRLATQYPDDAAVRGLFAKALLNAQNNAQAESDLIRRESLAEELRNLAAHYPEDAAVREPLANALSDIQVGAKGHLARESTVDKAGGASETP